MIASLLLIAAAAIAASALLWLSCSRLEAASHRLSRRYAIPDIVKGSIITAVASSVPELATALLALPVHDDFELGLSAIIGSAIYNILVIPAFAVFVHGRSLRANRELVFREAQFYLVSVTVVLLVVCLAVIYGGSVGAGSGAVTGQLTRGLAVIPLLLYGVYLFIQYEEVKDHRAVTVRDFDVKPWREWTGLVVSVGAIVVGVEILLRCAIALGDLLETPTFLWGLTVVAAATSFPDTFVSVQASRTGRSESSLSNVLGSNVFDLLVAVPMGVLVAGAVTVNFTQTVPMMGFLVLATIMMLVFMRHDMELTMTEATVLMLLYVAFGIWMAGEAFGITRVLGGG